MDFSQIRSGVQLKKVETVSDKSSPMLKGGLEESDIKQYKEDVLNTYVEEWGPLLETNQVTFRTDYTPIDSATAKFLEGCYLEFETFSEEEKYDSAAITNKFDEWFAEKARDPLCVRLLKNLQRKIDECTAKFGCKKVFVKGSSRSAKDSVIYTQQFKQDFTSRCDRLRNTGKLDQNSGMIALLGAGKDAMASDSATYFLRLFMRSHRIYQDLTLAKDVSTESNAAFNQGFAIREWVDIDIGMEFRAFVHENTFTAMCQYDYLVMLDQFQDEAARKALSDRLCKFWEDKVRRPLASDPKGRFASYVVDYAVDCTGKAWVIELNPFQESTDAALFSWARERELLMKGPYEFRVQQNKSGCGSVCLDKKWRGVFEESLGNLHLN